MAKKQNFEMDYHIFDRELSTGPYADGWVVTYVFKYKGIERRLGVIYHYESLLNRSLKAAYYPNEQDGKLKYIPAEVGRQLAEDKAYILKNGLQSFEEEKIPAKYKSYEAQRMEMEINNSEKHAAPDENLSKELHDDLSEELQGVLSTGAGARDDPAKKQLSKEDQQKYQENLARLNKVAKISSLASH